MVEEQDPDMALLNAAKQQLRSAMKQKLAALPQEAVNQQSSVIFDTLRSFRPYAEAGRVSIFLSMPSGEIQTDAIVRHALASGKEVFVPYLYRNPLASPGLPTRIMDMVRLRDLNDYESLQRDKWGIPSVDPATVNKRRAALGVPGGAASSEPSPLDLILVPGVAFDESPETGAIRRLGHGRGFYDYFIDRHRSEAAATVNQDKTPARPLLCGLALTEQFLSSPTEASVPVGSFDQRLDGLILGDGQVKVPLQAGTQQPLP